ncbi:unnamed protein product [Diamesa tonsa]
MCELLLRICVQVYLKFFPYKFIHYELAIEKWKKREQFVETMPFWRKRRYLVVLMAFFGFFNVYALRVNLSVAIVAMTENRTILHENGTTSYDQYFDWDSKQKGFVLSSFFYGYILTQFAGGYYSSRMGGNLIFGVGIGMTALLTLITPWAANMGVGTLIAVRVVEGIFEGVTFPCIHAVWSRWSPPLERSRMASLAFAGNYAGTVVSMPLSGILAVKYGWESIFYVFGAIGCIWFVCWIVIVKKSPQEDPFITEEEKRYIVNSLGNRKVGEVLTPPWKQIFTSTAVWAIVASHFSENWGFYTLLTQLPTFLKDTLHFQLEKTGFVSAIPYLTMGILLGVSGYLADWTQVKGYLTTTQVRRYFNCGAFLAQTVFMMLAAYLLEPTISVVCITIAVGLGAFAWSGFAVNHLDVAPQYASILMGISNTFATVPGIVSPLLTGFIVTTPSEEEWKKVFYLAAGIYLIGIFVYGIFASGKLQPWAVIIDEENKMTLNKLAVDDKNNYFDWDTKEQGLVLSSFFYGYILTQVIGGYIASRIGGKLLFGIGIGVTALLTLITPLAAKYSIYALVAVRVIEGLFEGITYSSLFEMWSKWAPPLERSRMVTYASSGNYIGIVISMPVSGLLASTIGWESVFYVFGAVGVVWTFFWMILIKASPDEDQWITEEEKHYIKQSLSHQTSVEKVKIPWKSIFTSSVVWAIVAAQVAEGWGFFTLQTQLPQFLKDVLGFDIAKLGLISAIPYLAMAITLYIAGYLADWVQIKEYLTTKQTRKYFNCGAFVVQTICMMSVTHFLNPTVSVVLITIGVGSAAFAYTSFYVNYLDIAPQFAGVLMGICNSFSVIAGIISPLLTGYIVTTPVSINFRKFNLIAYLIHFKSQDEWRIIFYISGVIYILGCIIYWIWCEGTVQPWAIQSSKTKNDFKTSQLQGYSNQNLDIRE